MYLSTDIIPTFAPRMCSDCGQIWCVTKLYLLDTDICKWLCCICVLRHCYSVCLVAVVMTLARKLVLKSVSFSDLLMFVRTFETSINIMHFDKTLPLTTVSKITVELNQPYCKLHKDRQDFCIGFYSCKSETLVRVQQYHLWQIKTSVKK